MIDTVRVRFRRRSIGDAPAKHWQAGTLRSITRQPNGDDFTVELVSARTGSLRTITSDRYEIHIGTGNGIPVATYANSTARLFGGDAS